MRRRTLYAAMWLLSLLFTLDPGLAQPAWAAGTECRLGQGSYTLVNTYAIAVSGVANGFSYQQSRHRVSLHMFHAAYVVKAVATDDGEQLDFKRQADGSLSAHSSKTLTNVLLCLYPDLTGGQPQTVYPTADAHGDALNTSNNVVAIGNFNNASSRTGDWPPGGEPVAATPSPGFPWHTLESIGDWVMRAIWVVSAIAGLFASRRRSQIRRE